MTIVARPYQQAMIDGALELWGRGRRRIAGVACTGAGKTVVIAKIAKMSWDAGRPVLVLAHRRELLDQAIDKLRQVNPDARIGLMKGSVKEYRADIVVGSVLTCATPGGLALLKSRQWGLIVVDEAHHSAAPTYQRILHELGAFTADGPLVLGVTATLVRTDALALGETFEDVIEPTVGLLDLIRQGYLVPPRGIRVKISDMDLRTVRKVAGDLNQGQLGAAMTAGMAPQRIVEAWTEHAKGRPTLAFLPTVAVSKELAEAFREAGFTAEHVDDQSTDDHRTGVLKSSAAGELDVICNVGLFGEGTDMPWLSAIILRLTMSPIVYTQQLGRGLRLFPGKKDCVILDPAGVTGRHKLATLVNLDGGADATVGELPDELLIYEDDIPDVTEDEDVEPAVPEYVDGTVEHELVDLFGESHSAWQRTDGGRWFLPVAAGFVYLEKVGPNQYDVCWRNGHSRGALSRSCDIGYAMAIGDDYVSQYPATSAGKDELWRKLPGRRKGFTRGQEHDDAAKRRASAALD